MHEDKADIIEEQMESGFKKLCKNPSAFRRLQAAIRQQVDPGISLIKLKQANSIATYFLCITTQCLHQVNQMYISGEFVSVLQWIFSVLLTGNPVIQIHNLNCRIVEGMIINILLLICSVMCRTLFLCQHQLIDSI